MGGASGHMTTHHTLYISFVLQQNLDDLQRSTNSCHMELSTTIPLLVHLGRGRPERITQPCLHVQAFFRRHSLLPLPPPLPPSPLAQSGKSCPLLHYNIIKAGSQYIVCIASQLEVIIFSWVRMQCDTEIESGSIPSCPSP